MTIEKRGNTYRITVYCGSDSTGKAIRQNTTYKPDPSLTKKQQYNQAYKFGLEFEQKIKQGINVKYDKLTFNQFCEMYFNNHAPTLKTYTAEQYKQITENRLKPYFGNMRVVNISSLDVLQWLASLEKDKKSNKPGLVLSENSKGVYFRTLSSMLGVAVKWNIINDNPCRRVTTPRKQSDVKALQQNQVIELFNKIDSYPDNQTVIAVYILILSGIRISELIGLQWNDINFSDNTIHVCREVMYIPRKGMEITPPKSVNSNRVIYIPEMLASKFQAYREQQNRDIKALGDYYNNQGYIITQSNGYPVHGSTIRKHIKKAFNFCGIPYVTVHGLRHTYASLLIANGMDIRTTASQLGHSTPSLLLNVYANPQDKAKKQASNMIEQIIKQKNI